MDQARDWRLDLYDSLHTTNMQEKFRKLAPVPVGAVFCQWPGMTMEDIRSHFRLMKELGFTALKQIMVCPGTSLREVMHAALDEGLIPWWYGEGGWEPITDGLLTQLGIPLDLPLAQTREHPRMLKYQEDVMRRRIDLEATESRPKRQLDPAIKPDQTPFDLPDELVPEFVEWLRDKYRDLAVLKETWNGVHVGFDDLLLSADTWDEVGRIFGTLSRKEYRRLRDVLRFKADRILMHLREWVEKSQARDPHEPVRAGGEMALFLPFAARGVDMEGIAETMAEGGSFYPSIHLAWHFDLVNYEIARTVYMQASLAADWFKGGWSATWESTGGPQQFSGGKRGDGFTVDAGTMTQLMLSYLAAGFRGFGFWCWSPRSAGWEAGEFALLDRNLSPTERTIRVGQVGQAARKYRDEIWQWRKEPLVGVYQDWDNEAIWGAMSVMGRDKFKEDPIRARIGATRALMNGNVPWEFVTATDLRKGLADRYKVIYLPGVIALGGDLMQILSDYVKDGGRLVVDMPALWYDDYGRLFPAGKDTVFERTFGCIIRDYYFSNNVPYRVQNLDLKGFVLDLDVTHGRVLQTYQNGRPAIVEAAYGRGQAVILGYEASTMCFKPGHEEAEGMLRNYTLGSYLSPYACDGAVVYRMCGPAADHYFLINDAPAQAVVLNVRDREYIGVTDAVSGDRLSLHEPISLEAFDGRWLRYEK